MTVVPPGTRFGAYEIVAPLGAGGMGEVYRATDTRLDRVIALKLLPPHWAQDPAMKQRFEREARIIASLNHPNICVLHDIGQQAGRDFLVMEFLEGETLAARLERGPIPWEEACMLALRIADALDKAHRKGVVHRDLKPANVILTMAGPKLLDFGLAKWTLTPASPHATSSQAVTLTNVTTPGTLIGTLQYMAPEQLEGTEADTRTDIFAFGLVLHEMITGKKTFEAKSRGLLIGAIAASDPAPLSSAQAEAPAALEHVVKVCLAKDPDERWQTARDLYGELEWALEAGAETGAGLAGRRRRRRKADWVSRAAVATAALLAIAVALPAALYLRGPAAPEEFRFRVPASGNTDPDTPSAAARPMAGENFAISPDGRTLVYSTRTVGNGPYSLYVRPLDSVTPRRLAATEGGDQKPFWSGDGRFIGFVLGGKLKKVEATGGPPQDICDVAGFSGAAWNRDGVILIGSATGLLRVSAEGGKPEPLTTLESGEAGHFWPQFLPDGRHFLYTSWTEESSKRAVMVGVLGSKDKTRVAPAESNAAYAESPSSKRGYLLFYRGNAVYAQPFDAKKLALSGEAARVADEVTSSGSRGNFAVSPNGALVYFTGAVNAAGGNNPSGDMSEWQFTWIDRAAKVLSTPGPPAAYRGVEVSPDGMRIAAHSHDAKGGNIVVIEPRGSVTSLTFDATHHNSSPVWSPKGDRIVYAALASGKWGLYQVLSNGSGTEEKVYESEAPKAPMSWSPDGKRIVFWVQDPKNSGDLWVLTLDEKGDKKAAPLISTPFNETHGQISPDGKWIAYTSNRSGLPEVWVQPFLTGTGLWRISYHGGDWPRWNPRNPKELFFRALGQTLDSPPIIGAFNPDLMFTVPVSANGAEFIAGDPKPLLTTFALNVPHSGGDYQFYAIGAKGDQILYGQFSPGSATAPAATVAAAISPDPLRDLTVALHWEAGLKEQ
jgi:Tol biopolymer transport system component